MLLLFLLLALFFIFIFGFVCVLCMLPPQNNHLYIPFFSSADETTELAGFKAKPKNVMHTFLCYSFLFRYFFTIDDYVYVCLCMYVWVSEIDKKKRKSESSNVFKFVLLLLLYSLVAVLFIGINLSRSSPYKQTCTWLRQKVFSIPVILASCLHFISTTLSWQRQRNE